MKIKVLGIDLAKHLFQLHGVDERGRVQLRKKLSRSKLLEFIAQLPPCLIGVGRIIGRGRSANLDTRFV